MAIGWMTLQLLRFAIHHSTWAARHNATLPHCHMPRTACLPAAHGASIKDSIKFNWKCPREAADCNFNWQLQQLHRRTDRGSREGEGEGGSGLHCSSKITSLIWLQIACCCAACVSLFVLAADSKSKNQLKIMCSSSRDREGRERRRWPDYLILISSQIRHCICQQQQQCHGNPFVLCPIQMAKQSVKAKAFSEN